MANLAAICTALMILLVAWPFCRAKLLHPYLRRRRRQVQTAWGQERKWVTFFGPYLGLADADRLCQHAGRPYGLTGVTLFQYQWLFALTCTAFFGAALSSGFGLAMGFFAWFTPRILLSAMAQQRRARIALELPPFMDLWGLLVAAGEGVEMALVEIFRRHPDWHLAVELRRAMDRVAASGLFGQSLVEEARITGSQELLAVAEQVRHLADGGGVPSRELARMAEQMREQRAAELAQSAGNLAVVGIFPKLGAVFLSLLPVVATIILSVMKQV